MKRALVLWDVDHTLIENGGVSKETYVLAYEMLIGVVPAVRPVTDGRTDYQIMRELFAANGVVLTDDRAQRLDEVLVAAMERKSRALRERGYALSGAVEALAALARVPAIVQSVLTGNIAPNAYTKLATFGLDRFVDLAVGGYGSDDIVRSMLVPAAQRKAAAKYGVEFDRSSTLLIGDTPLDVEAGLKGGALVLGVATGMSTEAELRAVGAHQTLPDLANLQDVLDVVADIMAIVIPR